MFLGYIDPGSGFTLYSLGGWFISLLLGLLGLFLVYIKKIFNFLKKRNKRTIIALLGVLIVASGIMGVIMTKRKSAFQKKIIILGFDGLSPEILEPMMEQGELPNFKHLKETGSYRRLRTTNPAQSPVAWAGFATGQNPGQNGVFDFIVRDPKTYQLNLSLANIKDSRVSRVLKTETFWQSLTERRIPTIIIGCPLTFPPDKVRGRMLSGMGVPDILGTEGTFTFYTSEPLEQNKDTGGKVFQIRKASIMNLRLIGPRVAALGVDGENIKIPLKATLAEGRKSVLLEHQNHECRLETGQWSNWQEVSFAVTPFKKMKGIFKFYLVELDPEFKLYISPIQFDPRDSYYPISYPADYSKELAAHLGLFHTLGMPRDTWAVNEKRLSERQLLDQADEVLKERTAVLNFELKRFSSGVLFCYFGGADTIQHMFWRYTDPLSPLYDKDAPQEYRNAIKAWYKKFDVVLGDVMKHIGEDDMLIALSDHGFSAFRRAVHVNTWLRKNGYLELKNPLALEGAELLQDIDWSKTKAYAVSFGAIYINQKGREKNGIVAAGPETEELKKEIAQKLEKWSDEKYGEPVVHGVYLNEEIFKGKYAKEAPDLYIGFNIGYRASWQTALGGVPKDLIEDNLKKWSGDHLFDPALVPGVLFSNRPIDKDAPSIYDLASIIEQNL